MLSGINTKKKLEKNIRSPFYKHHSDLPSEGDQFGLIEVVMDQKKVTDDKLVHVGVAILQESKLLFLRFVQFLRKFLKQMYAHVTNCVYIKEYILLQEKFVDIKTM